MIIQTLLEDHLHPTAEQICARVQRVMPDISPATVYNTLHELAEMGALLELNLGIGGRHYDVATTNHAHLVCLKCGRVEDVPCDCESLAPPPEYTYGFQITDCCLVFRGYCPVCISERC
jgi:Fe2+ or Zn2+ uptake regulation protein